MATRREVGNIVEHYKRLSGESGVVAYEIGNESITVLFDNGWRYLYTRRSAGAGNIAQMHKLARAGRGLSTFISQSVHDRYERKWQ